MKMFNSISFIVVMTVVALFLTYAQGQQVEEGERQTISISAHNTYIFGSSIRVKCDWVGANGKDVEEKSKWKFMETYYIPKKSKVEIEVPKDVKKCQIWGKLGKFKD